ncbi:MAG: AMP-binding protein [Reyranellaceae bacterium]
MTTVPALLMRLVEEQPEKELVRFLEDGSSYSRREVLHLAIAAAGEYKALGVQPGDRIALMLGNGVDFLRYWFGAQLCAAVVVPVNTEMRGPILANILGEVEPRVIVVGREAREQVEAVGPKAIVLQREESRPHKLSAPALSAEELQAARQALAAVAPGTLAAIQYTSGTTGRSKGTMCSQEMILNKAVGTQAVMNYGPDDVAFTALPLFHGNALFTTFVPALRAGARVAVAGRFSASKFWHQVADSGATTVNLLGTMAEILLRQPESAVERAHSLRHCLCIPWPKDAAAMERRFAVALTTLYGLTDSGTPLGVPFGQRREGSCGRPLKSWECRLIDAHDREVPVGQAGELVLRPREPFIEKLGYWGAPEETVKSWRNLWFHTGDVMRQDAEGWFYFVDRTKDMIRRAGENVSSFEVEQVMLLHPLVRQVAVIGVPSELGDDEVFAYVVPKEDPPAATAVLAEQLFDHCLDLLPYFAAPRFIKFVASLPRTASEKVKKSELRQGGIPPDAHDRGDSGRKAALDRRSRGPRPAPTASK